MALYDAFYRWCRDATDETHNWPAQGESREWHDDLTSRPKARYQLGTPGHGISFGEALRVWLRVAVLSFGGPAGQIAVMHRILVEEKSWISESRFLHALNYCMLLPGPEAQQLATYIGWLLHRTAGGLMAGGLFILPGVVSIMGLSYDLCRLGKVGIVAALFFGLKAAVLAIVMEAVIRVGKRALSNGVMVALAAVAFVAIFFFNVPFPVIILAAGVIGYVGAQGGRPRIRRGRAWRRRQERRRRSTACSANELPAHIRPTVGRALRVSAVWLVLWLVPVAALLIGARRRPMCSARSRCSSPRWRW